MANTDTIIGVLLLLTVFLGGVVFLFDSATHNIQDNQEQARQSFQADRVQTEYSTALRYAPNGTPLWRTISTHFKQTSFQNPSFERKEEVRNTFDEVYGENQWYFKAGWNLQNITLSFILDGSNTLRQERQDLKNNLPGLKNELKSRLGDNASITTNVFLLGDTVSCTSGFNTRGNCVEVHEEMYGLNPPYDAPTKPTVDGAFNANYDEDTLIEHDWASGTAYAEYYFREKQNLSQSKIPFLHIIFPVSDEFSTGSVQDKCMTDSDIVYSYVCALCEDSCSSSSSVYKRSNKSVENAVDVLNGTESVVNPVYSFAADTNISDSLNQPPFSTNTKANNQYGSPGGGNWCENASQCNGCTGRSPNIAFRNTTTCKTGVKNHMERLANATGGDIISLQDDSLSNAVESTVNDVLSANPFSIELGEPKGGTRFVAQRDIPIFGSQVAQATLYAYQKPTNTSLTIQDVDVHPSTVLPRNNTTAVLRSPAAQPLDVSVSQNGSSKSLRHIAGNVYAAKTNLSSGQYTSTFTAVTTDQRASQTLQGPNVTSHNLPRVKTKNVVSPENVSPRRPFNITVNTTKPINDAYVRMLGPAGNETTISLNGSGQSFTKITSISTYGEHHFSILLENNGVNRTYSLIDTVTVKDIKIPCTQESDCSAQEPYCTGNVSTNLTCSNIRASEGMYASNKSSCQKGLRLFGNKCIEPFRLAVVPVNFSFPSDNATYNTLVDQFEDFWEQKTFGSCSYPDKAVEVLRINEDCSPAKSACLPSALDMCNSHCASAVISCAQDKYSNVDKAEALLKGNGASNPFGPGTVTGCSPLASLTQDNRGSDLGGAIHATSLGFENGKGSAHELGHDFGLCHGRSNAAWSSTPSQKPCNPSEDGNCVPYCLDLNDDGTRDCTVTRTSDGIPQSCNGPECSDTQGSCIGCASSYCPNNDAAAQDDVMNYQNQPSYKFYSEEQEHLETFGSVQRIVDAC